MDFELTRQILANKFANNTHNLVWENLAQRIEIARISALFETYTGKPTWNSIGYTLKGPCYLSGDDHDRKIKPGNKEQILIKNTFVNRKMKLWNQLPAKALVSTSFRERVRKVA
jgi:hypothetical protein